MVEAAGKIPLGRLLAQLPAGSPLPERTYTLPCVDRRERSVIASITPVRWAGEELVVDLHYRMHAPVPCEQGKQVCVHLARRSGKAGKWVSRCPGNTSALVCGARVRTLYAHPRSGELGCRSCLDLRYRSTVTP